MLRRFFDKVKKLHVCCLSAGEDTQPNSESGSCAQGGAGLHADAEGNVGVPIFDGAAAWVDAAGEACRRRFRRALGGMLEALPAAFPFRVPSVSYLLNAANPRSGGSRASIRSGV